MAKQLHPHALVIPCPYQGHINPAIHLSLKLASKGFIITFINTQFIHSQITKAHSPSSSEPGPESGLENIFSKACESGLDIRYLTISDGFRLEFDRNMNSLPFLEGRKGDWWWNGEVQCKVEAKKAAYIKLAECVDEEEKRKLKIVYKMTKTEAKLAAKMALNAACMSKWGSKVGRRSCIGLQKQERGRRYDLDQVKCIKDEEGKISWWKRPPSSKDGEAIFTNF
ncbi:hypothetical protein H5410_044749 [Solanum commersonii]|uniref:Uncharacterized protein n=1 Tax=Solanum commersonii TaxID=4109 RepID=A0A9J5X7U5_SOLCO|nr:hypothetical protein H5410_044749 [Solanum commersonii]